MLPEFETAGFAILRSVIDRDVAEFMNRYALAYVAGGNARPDHQVPGTPAAYGAPLMEKLMINLIPMVEAASGRPVFPTYSYFRVYRKGDTLARHRDRAACEISLSLCLGYRASAPWPLFVEGPQGVCAAELKEGDGVLYKGTECPHWRDAFAGESAVQVFLHYVDQNGPFADWRFDKRALPNTGRLMKRSGVDESPVS